MAQQKYIPIDVYKRCIHIFIGSLDEFKKWAKDYYTDEEDQDFLNCVLKTEQGFAHARFFFNYKVGTGVVLTPIFPDNEIEIAALSHELLHATFFIANYCGLEYSYDGSNEHFTYLHEHLVRNALEKEGYKDV